MPTMELFRGEHRKTWQLRITDHGGIRRQLSTRADNRTDALTIAHKIELLIGFRIRGDRIAPELAQWISATHRKVREKLLEWDIVPAPAAEAGRPLYNDPAPDPLPADWRQPPDSLVDEWERELEGKENSDDYVTRSTQRVRVLLGTVVADVKPVRYWCDLTAEGILARVRELRRVGPPVVQKKKKRKPASPQTCEHYLDALQRFLAWLVSKGYALSNPAASLVAYSDEVIAANRKRMRRALTLEEQGILLTGTENLKTRWRMTGSERALLYRFVLRSGLRANEVRTLKVANFNFFTKTFTVLAANAKARREDTLPLAVELVELLKTHFTGKLPLAPAFSPLAISNYSKMFQEDLEDLGIDYKDPLDRYADFHALRHTFGTDLAKVVMPAIHQQLMRHKDIVTTMKFYTHLQQQDRATGLEKLPALPAAPVEKKAAG